MNDFTDKSAAKRPRRMAREPQAETDPAQNVVATAVEPAKVPDKKPSKVSLVLDMLSQPDGVTVDQLVEATGWLPHTTRAALTGLKKKGHVVTSEKTEARVRVYWIAKR